jgi:hypothetical protein
MAVVGVSSDPAKPSRQAVRLYHAQGWDVYPVNPRGGTLDGLPVYPSVAEIPGGPLTRVSLYVPPAVGLALVDEIARRGCDELWLNPGSESPELVARAEALGLRVVQACSLLAAEVDPG